MADERMTLQERFGDPERRFEFYATVLMSIAVVATAYCAYESTRWGGVQATAFASASTARVESSKALSRATQQTAYDASSLLQLGITYSTGSTEVAGQFAERFVRDEFRPFLDEWLALEPFKNPDAPATPFDLASYSNAEADRAAGLEEQAAAFFEEAKTANQTGDDYVLATVYFATVLFFSGIATKLDHPLSRWMVLVMAIAGLVVGFGRVLTLPFF